VIDTHLFAAAHADDHVGGYGEGGTGEPDVHDADFGHSGAVRREDGGGEADAFLKDVIAAFAHWDGLELLYCGADDDADTGEGIEGLEDIVFRVAGEFC